jgi:signal transduction histidine kinase
MKSEMKFRTRARIIQQLGYQLIKNENIALMELIKNSYDADASLCSITMQNVENIDIGKIIVTDNGEGMDKEILRNSWLEIGTDYKDLLSKNINTKRTQKFKRVRLGEKGIGRLGIHRLGRKIQIISKRNNKEYILSIDWDNIETNKYIDDAVINIQEVEPSIIKTQTGTSIIIQKLRTQWNKNMVRECYNSILSLNSPFDSIDSFKTSFKINNNEWIKDLLTYNDIEAYKLFSFSVEVEGENITKFNYEFLPWKVMTKLKPKKININDKEIKNVKRMVYKENQEIYSINLNNYKIGPILFKGHIFDRDRKVLELSSMDPNGLKEYLDQNGGIRIYRDNMRVYDYGEPGNDWLNLGGRRVNIPTKRISNNILIGAIYLERERSEDLKEKANREGFIENNAYYAFCRSIHYIIDKIEMLRKIDKEQLRIFYGPKQISEPVITTITDLKEFIDSKISNIQTKNEISKYLDRIETEYERITDSLIKSAGAGLNLIIVIHQIEKVIKDIIEMINRNIEKKYLMDRVIALSALIEGYSVLIKKSPKKIRNLIGIINQAVFNMQFRFEAHKITIIPNYKSKKKNIDAFCSEDLVLNALMNVFDNSIWWLGYSKTQKPSIFIDIIEFPVGYIGILIADNGPGFTLSTEEIIKPFVTNKPGGMGIGLHITNQIMTSLSGKLIFPDDENIKIPWDNKRGAILLLSFKKEELK